MIGFVVCNIVLDGVGMVNLEWLGIKVKCLLIW